MLAFSIERKWLRANSREIHDVQQWKKIAPFITHEISFGQEVSEMVFGVNIFDLDFGVHVDSVKQIERDSVDSGHVSDCWASSFDDHLDHSFVVFKMYNCA